VEVGGQQPLTEQQGQVFQEHDDKLEQECKEVLECQESHHVTQLAAQMSQQAAHVSQGPLQLLAVSLGPLQLLAGLSQQGGHVSLGPLQLLAGLSQQGGHVSLGPLQLLAGLSQQAAHVSQGPLQLLAGQ